jgi:hypothetical protein
MPAILANSPKFRATTDYPSDKIVCLETGSFVIAPTSVGTTTIAHGLPFTPLMDGTWSTDSTFQTVSYDMGTGSLTTAPGFIFNAKAEVSADSSDITVEVENITGSSVTAYYRVFGFQPSTANLEVPFTDYLADSFVVNTDFNHTKLFAKDRVTSNTVVAHNIGHRPQVSLWEELSGGSIRKKNENDVYNTFGVARASVSDTSLTITFEASGPAAIHYRLYVDE